MKPGKSGRTPDLGVLEQWIATTLRSSFEQRLRWPEG
ncbi:Uncharacterised protein [Yersinia mollaretii]|uniref:Uncharacterized protein n=1 Tax=Yersinia mollaretii TaxID=33060 RepID=A0AA36PK52_YERMO|nr:Uncharacterised protein [Yersinia mollaretii]CNI28835.1 Uncharacterised protein [Yersinia mollaretii]CQJ33126.1 Uncharacterised protein [Yersinia mollaretii]